jgi:hypothetical protein
MLLTRARYNSEFTVELREFLPFSLNSIHRKGPQDRFEGELQIPMEQSSDRIRIVVVVGTVRPGNYTSNGSALIIDELKSRSASPLILREGVTAAINQTAR